MTLKKLKVFVWQKIYQLKGYHKEAPVFIVGCGHSGTTLMIRILSENSQVYSINRESNVFRENWIDRRTIASWLKNQRKENKQFFAEKTPSHVRYLDDIFSIFPFAKIIVMVRDGRDVVLSLEKRTNDLNSSIERWIDDNKCWLDDYELDHRVLAVKLEDFTANSADTLEKICAHVDIAYDPQMLSYSEREYNYQNSPIQKTDGSAKGHQSNRNWQINQPIFKDTNRWKKELDNEKSARLFSNAEFTRLMKKFNYID